MSANLVTLRTMVTADVDAVVAIENSSYSMPWGESTFRALLKRGDADLIVAEMGPTVTGYAVWWHTLDQGELGNVAVDEAFRRRGVASQLVAESVRRAAARHVREMFLEVRQSNHGARDLYARLGFLPVGVRRGYYIRPVEDAIVMRLAIPRAS
ncbi:MAG: ribosomal protein S18-alanine N-acetyltransferase [Longimicrobiales bacterium]